MNQTTKAALKCAKALRDWAYPEKIALAIDRETDLPALIAVALAAQGVIDAGAPHGAFHTSTRPNGCECEQCECWQTLKSCVEKLGQEAGK